MNVQVSKGFESFGSSILLSHISKQPSYKPYKPDFEINLQQNTNLQHDTAVILSTTIKEIGKSEEAILELIRRKNVKVDDENLLKNLLGKLEPERLNLLYQIMDYLIKNNYKFSIEVYETDSDLESLYFVIHFAPETNEEKIDEEILKLAKYKRSIDKNKLLWFVGFAREIEDV